MNQELAPQEQAIAKALAEAGLPALQVGDMFITRHGEYRRIDALTVDEAGEVMIAYSERTEDGAWEPESECSLADWRKYEFIRLVAPIAQLEQEATAALDNPAALDPWGEAEPDTAASTDLVPAGTSPQQVLQLRDALQTQIDRVETLRRIIAAKVQRVQAIVAGLTEKLAAVNKVIGALHLYLGTDVEIVQIRPGRRAGPDAPIFLYQQVCFMDEEAGDPNPNPLTGQPGIDWGSIEDFDRWVAEPAHCDQLLPTSRGIRALKPSRQERTYFDDNEWLNMEAQAKNQRVYLLARNGDRLYRVWAPIRLGDRLFPGPEEAQRIFRTARGAGESDSRWGGRSFFAQRDAQNEEFEYKKIGLLLQGLIDRPPLFQPLAHPLNLFDPPTYQGLLETVFDAEPALYTGQEYYADWKARINAQIQRGTRLLVALNRGYIHHQLGQEVYARFHSPRYGGKQSDLPPLPPSGVYTVEDVLPPDKGWFWNPHQDEERLIIRYNPRDNVCSTGWTWTEPHERKVRVSFTLYRSDPFLLNYDLLDLPTVEHYLASRIERQAYLHMIPVLWGMRRARRQELEWERHFVTLVAQRLDCAEDLVWAAVEWWKNKVIWKRPITQDDAKALRMIEARLRRELAGPDSAPSSTGDSG